MKYVQLIISPLFLAKFSRHSRRSVGVSLVHSVSSPIILKGSCGRYERVKLPGNYFLPCFSKHRYCIFNVAAIFQSHPVHAESNNGIIGIKSYTHLTSKLTLSLFHRNPDFASIGRIPSIRALSLHSISGPGAAS